MKKTFKTMAAFALTMSICMYGAIVPSVAAIDPDLIMWDTFTYSDGTAPADGTALSAGDANPALKLQTGGAQDGKIGWKAFERRWVDDAEFRDYNATANVTIQGWRLGDNSKIVNTTQNTTATKLEYRNLDVSGVYVDITQDAGPARSIQTNHLHSPPSSDFAFYDYIGNANNLTDGYAVGGVEGKTLWFANLVRIGGTFYGGGDYTTDFLFYRNDKIVQLGVGAFGGGADKPDKKWGIKYRTSDYATSTETAQDIVYAESDLASSLGQTVLVVVKFEFNATGNTVITAYFNPTNLGDTENEPETTHTVSATLGADVGFRFDIVKLAKGLWSGASAQVGEIRFGKTYASVTPTDGTDPGDPDPGDPDPGDPDPGDPDGDLLMSLDFTYEDGEIPPTGTQITTTQYADASVNVEVGKPIGTGWSSPGMNGTPNGWSGWRGGNNAFVANTHDASVPRNPMSYGGVETSGVYVNTHYKGGYGAFLGRMIAVGEGSPIPELALADYIGSVPLEGVSNWPSNAVGGKDGTLWYSALIRQNETAGNKAYVAFGSDQNVFNFQGQLYIGYFDPPKVEPGDEEQEIPPGDPAATGWEANKWGIRYRTESHGRIQLGANPPIMSDIEQETHFKYAMSDKAVSLGETVLVVVKFDFGGGTEYTDGSGKKTDKVTVWFNPDVASLGGDEPTGGSKAEAEFPEGIDLAIRIAGMGASGSATSDGNGAVDFGDLRFGKTYASVTPTVELPPNSLTIDQDGKLQSVEFDTSMIVGDFAVAAAIYSDAGQLLAVEYMQNPELTDVVYTVKKLDLLDTSLVCGNGQKAKVFVWGADTIVNYIESLTYPELIDE